MLKYLFLSFLLVGVAIAQSDEDEYFNVQKSKKYTKLLKTEQQVVASEKWYVGSSIGGFNANNTLGNDFGGLFLPYRKGDAWAGFELGYHHHNQLMAEVGYFKSIYQYGIQVRTSNATAFRYSETLRQIPFRFKYRVWRIGKIQKLSGLYVGVGGVWTLPKDQRKIGSFNIRALQLNGRGIPADTILIANQTNLLAGGHFLPEANAELQINLSKRFDLSIFGRYQWGFNPIIRSDLGYYRNSQLEASTTQQTNGTGYSFGFGLRYFYAIRQRYRVEE